MLRLPENPTAPAGGKSRVFSFDNPGLARHHFERCTTIFCLFDVFASIENPRIFSLREKILAENESLREIFFAFRLSKSTLFESAKPGAI